MVSSTQSRSWPSFFFRWMSDTGIDRSMRCTSTSSAARMSGLHMRHQATTVAFILAHRRDADFQFRHAERVELARDVQLLLQRERHPGGLFAVAQGGVV